MTFKKNFIIFAQLHPLYMPPLPQTNFPFHPLNIFCSLAAQVGLGGCLQFLSSTQINSTQQVSIGHICESSTLLGPLGTMKDHRVLSLPLGNPDPPDQGGKLCWSSKSGLGLRLHLRAEIGKVFINTFNGPVWLWKERFKNRLGRGNCSTEEAELLCAKSNPSLACSPGSLRNRVLGPESGGREKWDRREEGKICGNGLRSGRTVALVWQRKPRTLKAYDISLKGSEAWVQVCFGNGKLANSLMNKDHVIGQRFTGMGKQARHTR